MESPIYITLSGQMAMAREMEAIANNIANMNTTAFKQQRVLFNEFLSRPAPREQISLVIDRATRRDISPGPLEATGNPLDLAIVGDGYFVVDTVNGPRFTRAGRFTLNDQNQITTLTGLPLLDQGNQPIVVPPDAGELRISGNGTIASAANPAAPLGQINLVRFQNEQAMLEVGGGLYASETPPEPAPPETRVNQGVIEQSNVQSVLEMTRMIDMSRAYQRAQRMIDGEHERMRSAIQRLSRPV